jgi:hypothetical protein
LNKCSAIGPKTWMRSVFVADFTGNDNTVIQSGAQEISTPGQFVIVTFPANNVRNPPLVWRVGALGNFFPHPPPLSDKSEHTRQYDV